MRFHTIVSIELTAADDVDGGVCDIGLNEQATAWGVNADLPAIRSWRFLPHCHMLPLSAMR